MSDEIIGFTPTTEIVDEDENGNLFMRQRNKEDRPAILLYEMGVCKSCKAIVYGQWDFMEKKVVEEIFSCCCPAYVLIPPPDHYTVIRFKDGTILTLDPGKIMPPKQPEKEDT